MIHVSFFAFFSQWVPKSITLWLSSHIAFCNSTSCIQQTITYIRNMIYVFLNLLDLIHLFGVNSYSTPSLCVTLFWIMRISVEYFPGNLGSPCLTSLYCAAMRAEVELPIVGKVYFVYTLWERRGFVHDLLVLYYVQLKSCY